MAKGKRTTSKARRATAPKATKAAPVEWGMDANGRQIVTRARGSWVHDLPVAQWQGLRTTIADLQDVADGINALRTYPPADVSAALAVIAVHSVSLIDTLAERARSVLALSPRLREDLAKADARMSPVPMGAHNDRRQQGPEGSQPVGPDRPRRPLAQNP